LSQVGPAVRASFFDTSSLPTDEMRDAMRAAELGDDVYRTDPTVAALERRAAELFEREAALFVPSGTMANLIAILVHANRGDAVVVEAGSHIAIAETGGLAAVAGCMPIPVEAPRGTITASLLADAVLPEDQHRPRPTLVCVENTHNRAGGTVTRPETMRELAAACHERGLKLHVDGARIFNGAVALGVPVAGLAAGADSVTFALSKGLSCPVGSVLIGSAGFVHEAQRARKLLGGAMRQAGVLAAAGIVALESGVERLADDHRRARELAERLDALPELSVDVAAVETNIVVCDVSGTGRDARTVAGELEQAGIECAPRPPSALRFVTHRGIGDDEVDLLVAAFAQLAR
jgi:threonine aldolase